MSDSKFVKDDERHQRNKITDQKSALEDNLHTKKVSKCCEAARSKQHILDCEVQGISENLCES